MNLDFIKFDKDGKEKPFYLLSSEKDINETQIKSDENELDYKYSQNNISKEEYEIEKKKLDMKLNDQNYVYDLLIFDQIKNKDINSLKEEIKEAKLDNIELKRLSESLGSIAEKKISDFQKNNKQFKEENLSEWNEKYNIIAKYYEKIRELEGFILGLTV